MLGQIFKVISEFLKKPSVQKGIQKTVTNIAKKGHHSKAISEGLRKGSSEAAKIMAKWRWKQLKIRANTSKNQKPLSSLKETVQIKPIL